MATDRKINQGITKQRDVTSTSVSGDTVTRTITETWVGPYDILKKKQEAVWRNVISTGLNPTAADGGQLTITREEKIVSQSANNSLPPATTEVIWQELRLPIAQHPYFSTLTADQVRLIRAAAEGAEEEATLPPDAGPVGAKLYSLLAAGTTEYATGVPVVRRTSTRRAGNAGGGNAWIRGNPPVNVAGDWDWLKTADERRKDGDTFTLVEEWTGAKEWDTDLY